jgi:hypothetical protein
VQHLPIELAVAGGVGALGLHGDDAVAARERQRRVEHRRG